MNIKNKILERSLTTVDKLNDSLMQQYNETFDLVKEYNQTLQEVIDIHDSIIQDFIKEQLGVEVNKAILDIYDVGYVQVFDYLHRNLWGCNKPIRFEQEVVEVVSFYEGDNVIYGIAVQNKYKDLEIGHIDIDFVRLEVDPDYYDTALEYVKYIQEIVQERLDNYKRCNSEIRRKLNSLISLKNKLSSLSDMNIKYELTCGLIKTLLRQMRLNTIDKTQAYLQRVIYKLARSIDIKDLELKSKVKLCYEYYLNKYNQSDFFDSISKAEYLDDIIFQ